LLRKAAIARDEFIICQWEEQAQGKEKYHLKKTFRVIPRVSVAIVKISSMCFCGKKQINESISNR